jgi:hypothetical protein
MFFFRPTLRRLVADVNFWKNRALAIEKELENERSLNRKREILLLDRVLVSKGSSSVKRDSERNETTFVKPPDMSPEVEALERLSFIESSVRDGINEAEAQRYWETVIAPVLTQ